MLPQPSIKVKNSKTTFFLIRFVVGEFHTANHALPDKATMLSRINLDVTTDQTAKLWLAYKICDVIKEALRTTNSEAVLSNC